MSLHDDLTAVRRDLDELARKVERLERTVGRQDPGGRRPAAPDPSRMVTIPDAPYDSTLWTDTDDEGLGARDRRAP
ncbi:hypothetical protein ACFWHQ_21375 [Streptomyces sp. NPDC060334]|uniref:hypothetical protein n=1 Tax=unclassified Streptomyces TaxID=2593676 RepID=UPI0006AFA04C|nr:MULTISPECIES: hypothetical protein [unclassified Streptomyces]KOU60983.1 hypothetical protein ADK55_09740 [Streptomyces sp. WM4235]MCX5073574.1 hypothetical protein [Streptomyces sp. NBC_00424]MCX5154876.1 hypothetical protein [Streptomyces sp. NBC_00291]WUD43180.1 hypothetical protein OHA84_23195 [Streptomyces sp. NBC_00513]